MSAETLERELQALVLAILDAARVVAEPVQRRIMASEQRQTEAMWLGIAFEAISFFLVMATRAGLSHGPAKAQWMINAVGRLLLPEIRDAFFSRSGAEAQAALLDGFLAGHYHAEIAYSACGTVLPRHGEHDANAMAVLLTDRLANACGRDSAANVRSLIHREICDAIGGGAGAEIFVLANAICEALPNEQLS